MATKIITGPVRIRVYRVSDLIDKFLVAVICEEAGEPVCNVSSLSDYSEDLGRDIAEITQEEFEAIEDKQLWLKRIVLLYQLSNVAILPKFAGSAVCWNKNHIEIK